jgi:cell division protein ZapE
MNQIHASLRQKKNLARPLQAIARDIAAEVQVLCLDEFVIIDIGDAMIMAGLLETLFADGVTLVTTSNAAPQDLYRDGLQRSRFIPAIDLLQHHCQVVHLDGGQDYRLRFLQQTDLYSVPHDDACEQRIRGYIDQQVSALPTPQRDLVVNGRILAHHFCAGDTVWFSFAELCETARSQTDYLELARFFNTVIVTGIRQMDKTSDDVARRFVLLIDVLYDHHVKLICSAAVSPERLYLGSRLSFEFERTVSRLLEMQSGEYLAQAHSQQ